MTYALDIGHGENTWETRGGKGVHLSDDLGGGRMEEHWFNSAVAIYAKELLDHNGIKTVFGQKPHKNDVHLTTRTNYYNNLGVKAVISIHANAGSHKADGACCFYWHTANGSRKMAEIWKKHASKHMEEVGFHGNGFHASKRGSWTNLHMCRETEMKAILIEHGFMTNSGDIRWLLDDGYRRDCAEVIARLICDMEGVSFKPLARTDSKGSQGDSTPSVVKAFEHKIQKGDTIWGIAQETKGVDVEDIMTLNPGLDPENLEVGQTIQLKRQGKAEYHTIEKGDTLWGIAERYKTTVGGIKKLNKGLDPHNLEIGSKIKVDGSESITITPKKPRKKTNRTLRMGSKGNDVRELQNKLNSFGFGVGAVDGIFGPQTQTGVKQFQKANKLAVDGIVGPNTHKALSDYRKRVNTSYKGKRVESHYDGVIDFYSKATWNDSYKVGHVKKGQGFPYILAKVKVDGSYMYRVKNSKGKIFYITAHEKYVHVE